MNWEQANEDYIRIEKAILYLEEHVREQPDLARVASELGLSEYHFQRLFTRWAGISPKRFLQYLTREQAKQYLERSTSLLETTYAVGLSSPGRLHDLFVTTEAVTPGEYKQAGKDLEILYGIHPTPFGPCLLGMTDRGICQLAFVAQNQQDMALAGLQKRWRLAVLRQDQSSTRAVVDEVLDYYARQIQGSPTADESTEINLHLAGTNFQIKVWEALLRIPAGHVVSYDHLAGWLGKPGGPRAVGNAIAHNPVALLIPCHRVIYKAGDFGHYQWGAPRKKAILGWEWSRISP